MLHREIAMNMKLVVEKIPDLAALYVRQLRLLLSGEEVIAIKIPFFRESATDPELIEFFHASVRASESHAAELRGMLSHSPEGSSPLKSKVVYALCDEAEDLIEAAGHASVRDSVLVVAAQRIKLRWRTQRRRWDRAAQCEGRTLALRDCP